MDEELKELAEEDLWLMKKISRENNKIPPCKVIKPKNQYKRWRKSTAQVLNDLEEDNEQS